MDVYLRFMKSKNDGIKNEFNPPLQFLEKQPEDLYTQFPKFPCSFPIANKIINNTELPLQQSSMSMSRIQNKKSSKRNTMVRIPVRPGRNGGKKTPPNERRNTNEVSPVSSVASEKSEKENQASNCQSNSGDGNVHIPPFSSAANFFQSIKSTPPVLPMRRTKTDIKIPTPSQKIDPTSYMIKDMHGKGNVCNQSSRSYSRKGFKDPKLPLSIERLRNESRILSKVVDDDEKPGSKRKHFTQKTQGPRKRKKTNEKINRERVMGIDDEATDDDYVQEELEEEDEYREEQEEHENMENEDEVDEDDIEDIQEVKSTRKGSGYTKSQYVGVIWHAPSHSWMASRMIDGAKYKSEYFSCEIDAAIASDEIARKHTNAYCRTPRLNFPRPEELTGNSSTKKESIKHNDDMDFIDEDEDVLSDEEIGGNCKRRIYCKYADDHPWKPEGLPMEPFPNPPEPLPVSLPMPPGLKATKDLVKKQPQERRSGRKRKLSDVTLSQKDFFTPTPLKKRRKEPARPPILPERPPIHPARPPILPTRKIQMSIHQPPQPQLIQMKPPDLNIRTAFSFEMEKQPRIVAIRGLQLQMFEIMKKLQDISVDRTNTQERFKRLNEAMENCEEEDTTSLKDIQVGANAAKKRLMRSDVQYRELEKELAKLNDSKLTEFAALHEIWQIHFVQQKRDLARLKQESAEYLEKNSLLQKYKNLQDRLKTVLHSQIRDLSKQFLFGKEQIGFQQVDEYLGRCVRIKEACLQKHREFSLSFDTSHRHDQRGITPNNLEAPSSVLPRIFHYEDLGNKIKLCEDQIDEIQSLLKLFRNLAKVERNIQIEGSSEDRSSDELRNLILLIRAKVHEKKILKHDWDIEEGFQALQTHSGDIIQADKSIGNMMDLQQQILRVEQEIAELENKQNEESKGIKKMQEQSKEKLKKTRGNVGKKKDVLLSFINGMLQSKPSQIFDVLINEQRFCNLYIQVLGVKIQELDAQVIFDSLDSP